MPVYRWANIDAQTDDDLENDLPSVASSAAVDIDHLAQGKVAKLAGLQKLLSYVRALADSASTMPSSAAQVTFAPGVSPSAMVVIRGAMMDSGWKQGVNKVDDLIKTAAKVNQQFTALLEAPAQFKVRHPDELESMKRFCLALSRRALAGEQSLEEIGAGHPLRRVMGVDS